MSKRQLPKLSRISVLREMQSMTRDVLETSPPPPKLRIIGSATDMRKADQDLRNNNYLTDTTMKTRKQVNNKSKKEANRINNNKVESIEDDTKLIFSWEKRSCIKQHEELERLRKLTGQRKSEFYKTLVITDALTSKYERVSVGDGAIVASGEEGKDDYIARIEAFYDIGATIDSKYACVTWFFKQDEMPKSRLPANCFSNEIFLCVAESDKIIDAETITKSCRITWVQEPPARSTVKHEKTLNYYYRKSFNGRHVRVADPPMDKVVNGKNENKPKEKSVQDLAKNKKAKERKRKNQTTTISGKTPLKPTENSMDTKQSKGASTPVKSNSDFVKQTTLTSPLSASKMRMVDVSVAALDILDSANDSDSSLSTHSSKASTRSSRKSKSNQTAQIKPNKSTVKSLKAQETSKKVTPIRIDKNAMLVVPKNKQLSKTVTKPKANDRDLDSSTKRLTRTVEKTVSKPSESRRSLRLYVAKEDVENQKQLSNKARRKLVDDAEPNTEKTDIVPTLSRHKSLRIATPLPNSRKQNINGSKDEDNSTEDDSSEDDSSEKESDYDDLFVAKIDSASRKKKRRSVRLSCKKPDLPKSEAKSNKARRQLLPKSEKTVENTTDEDSSGSDEDISDEDKDFNASGSDHSSSDGQDDGVDSEEDFSTKLKLKTPRRVRILTPRLTKSVKKGNAVTPIVIKTPKNRKPFIPQRKTPLRASSNVFDQARERLHVSATPDSLPCREEEFQSIYSFVEGKILSGTGGCMYISGVPGTGKTATVMEVLSNLRSCVDDGNLEVFKYVEINGMRLTEPHQAYVQILKQLKDMKATPEHASQLLTKHFDQRGKKTTVLLVDELDLLWTKKQDVMYHIFDWPSHRHARLVVVAIANTMDLPERIMMNRVSSRLGLTRLSFLPYNFRQLQAIVSSRLSGLDAFDSDAIQLVSRKVAAVSGDARRCLDICRRAVEIAAREKRKNKNIQTVGIEHVHEALQEMFASPMVMFIRNCSTQEKLFLRATVSEFRRSGLEEATVGQILQHHVTLAKLDNLPPATVTSLIKVCNQLAASHVLLMEMGRHDLYARVRLNVSIDDVLFALNADS
uniref:Origin recognition complex subunit 1 n=1 Tax=Phallusia mammillata TaxID=59560 RepID=A0A6F9DNL6_9ASCI|nr:origin recognition complex subunit 1-like [Phallusia mammillata]